MKGALLWLIGIPIPIIILLYLLTTFESNIKVIDRSKLLTYRTYILY